MIRANRAISVLALTSLLTLDLSGTARAQGPTIAKKTFTVSGTIGLPGVTLQGFPGRVVTDENGVYSVEVPQNWTGTVVPAKVGYVFQPPRREYAAVDGNRTGDDYTCSLVMFTISGSVGVPGVTMRGLPGNPVTGAQGDYVGHVPYGWAGDVTPVKPGYVFEPPSVDWGVVTRDYTDHNYAARVLTFTISGRVWTHAGGASGTVGVPGVILVGLPGEAVTDAEGRYAATVEYGWSGAVVPRKEGFSFEPASREYATVTADQKEQFFISTTTMVAISNVLTLGEEPLEGAMVRAEPGDYRAMTDSKGRYRVTVPRGWSGRLTFSKPGFEIQGDIKYSDIQSDVIDGRSASVPGEWPPVPTRVPGASVPTATSDVLVIPTSEVTPEQLAETTEDLRVMLHIFREKLSEPRMILGVLRDYGNFFGADRKVEALYLQGTAAVFVIEVDFPYSFPRQRTQESEATKEEAVDPVWQRARQRLYSPPGSRGYGASGQAGQAQEMTFEQFQEELLRSLKHAANLRNIDPDELVILTIVAQSEEAGWPGHVSYTRGTTRYGVSGVSASRSTSRLSPMPTLTEQTNPRLDPLGRPATPRAVPPTTVLTMQARKADIDAFAQGDLDFERFRQKVRTFTY
jgi:hypothetical protein